MAQVDLKQLDITKTNVAEAADLLEPDIEPLPPFDDTMLRR